jgi:predicted TIM-barrel fold metal-dependent hydrolase
LHEADFDEMWAAAERADLAIAIHTGWNMQSLLNKMDSFYCSTTLGVMPSMMGLFSMLGGGILERFPKLRVGFFEAGADWLPYMINRMERLWEVYSRNKWPGLTRHRPSHWLKRGNVYFCCEGDERFLPHVAELLGDDHIITSADLPHDEALDEAIKKIDERPDLSLRLKSKILNENPARFYGL